MATGVMPCCCGLPAMLSGAGASSFCYGGGRLWWTALVSADLGGSSFNKKKLKVGSLLFLACSAFLLLLAGRGGEGKGWGDAGEHGSGGDGGSCAVFGRKLPSHLLVEGRPCSSLSSAAIGAKQHRSPTGGDRWADFAVSTTVLAEGRPFSSLSSAASGAKQRRSPPAGDRRADFAVPATVLAEGRPWVARLCADHHLQPPGIKPFRRPCCSSVVAASHGALVIPSGFVPGDGEVDLELIEGLDCVPKFVLEVLYANSQDLLCIFLCILGSAVMCCVIPAIY